MKKIEYLVGQIRIKMVIRKQGEVYFESIGKKHFWYFI